MPFSFACPYCGLETLADDEYAGSSGPCAACRRTVTVPVPDGAPSRSPPRPAARPGEAARRFGWLSLGLLLVAAVGATAATLGLLVGVLFPALHAARIRLAEKSCAENLRRIGRAMSLYESDFGCLPPAFVAGPDGKPAHSWRVLILPYLGERGLYDRYDFAEPWDGPHNAELTRQMPEVYACPADPAARKNGEASYRVVVGSRTAFAGSQPRKRPDFRDDPKSTILVVEAPVSGITWLEPQDLAADRIDLLVNSGLDRGIGSHHRGGANVLMADGTVRFLKNATPAELVPGMLSVDGEEQIAADELAE